MNSRGKSKTRPPQVLGKPSTIVAVSTATKRPTARPRGFSPCHFLPFSLRLFPNHSSLITHHSSLSSTHPVNFYCGLYGSSPRKTKGHLANSKLTKKKRRCTATTPSAVSLLSSAGLSLS